MTKSDIISEVSSNTGLSKVETEAVLEGIIGSISKALKEGNRVDIRGFGSFIVKERKAREARNPSTNKVINLNLRYIPSFKVSKILKESVNNSILRGF
jgi:nucleoid DNA-binding protein